MVGSQLLVSDRPNRLVHKIGIDIVLSQRFDEAREICEGPSETIELADWARFISNLNGLSRPLPSCEIGC